MTMLKLDEDNPPPRRNPAETMLGIAVGTLAIVVVALLLYANKDWVLEVAKKIF